MERWLKAPLQLEDGTLKQNLDKTRIVYCKDSNRKGSHEHEQFTFLGYTFRPQRAQNRSGELFVSFCPAVSDDAAKAMRRSIRRWRLNLQSGDSLADLAQEINPTVRGWISFYGRFYRSELVSLLENINEHLARWAMRKFKRLRGRPRRARRLLAAIAAREPDLFAHWSAERGPWLDDKSPRPRSRETFVGLGFALDLLSRSGSSLPGAAESRPNRQSTSRSDPPERRARRAFRRDSYDAAGGSFFGA